MGCVGTRASKEGHFFEVYSLGKKLGQGSFGQVREATKRSSGEVLVVKIVDVRGSREFNSDTIDPKKFAAVSSEIKLWQLLGTVSQHTVQLFDTFKDHGVHYLVMEKCRCSLLDNLEESLHASQADIRRMFRDMIAGIKHCHSCSVAHRDVKLDNYLLGMDGVIKLADFGLATLCQNGQKISGVAGTPPYMAPEMLNGHRYGTKVDLWAFGTTAYVLLYGNFPYGPQARTADEMKDAIASGVKQPSYRKEGLGAGPSKEGRAFVHALLQRDPLKRVNAEQALKLAFIHPKFQRGSTGTLPVTNDEPEPEASELRPLAQMIRGRSKDFKPAIDPTVQRSLDELLQLLEERGCRRTARGVPGFNRSFSLSAADAPAKPVGGMEKSEAPDEMKEEEALRQCRRRKSISRALTFGGREAEPPSPPPPISFAPPDRAKWTCGLAPIQSVGTETQSTVRFRGTVSRESSSSTRSNVSGTHDKSVSGEWSDDLWFEESSSDATDLPSLPPPLPQCHPSNVMLIRRSQPEPPRCPPQPGY